TGRRRGSHPPRTALRLPSCRGRGSAPACRTPLRGRPARLDALFPHMTVFENIAFGLRMRRTPATQLRARVDEVLALVGLPGLGGRSPHQLSGGQQQRVALARAIAVRPAVLLLDELLFNLDLKLQEGMRLELKRLHRELGTTTIFVTHDQTEALVLSS